MEHKILVESKSLTKIFEISRKNNIKAVDEVSFHMHQGEILSIVGESGSGKSTLVKAVMGIHEISSGKIFYDDIDISSFTNRKKNKERLEKEIQLIFQDPMSSLNQRMTVEKIISEPLVLHKIFKNKLSLKARISELLIMVGLDDSFLRKYPGEISGGQRQRVAIARALALRPRLVVADEPVASLDASVQAQIINLFRELQREQGFSFLLISHDLSMVKFISDRVAVMCKGRIVEIGPAKVICENPVHPYSRALISAAPKPEPFEEKGKIVEFFTDYSSLKNKTLQLISEDHWVLK